MDEETFTATAEKEAFDELEELWPGPPIPPIPPMPPLDEEPVKWQIECFDVNDDGLVDLNDVQLILRHYLGLQTLNMYQADLADTSAVGDICECRFDTEINLKDELAFCFVLMKNSIMNPDMDIVTILIIA